MLGEGLVVSAGLHQVALRREQLKPDRHRVKAADEKEERHCAEIQQRDALVILCQQPRLQPVLSVEIIRAWRFWYFEFFHENNLLSV